MKSISNASLAQLGSLNELRAAKIKVNRAIKRAEDGMMNRYDSAKDMFSWTNIICNAFSVIDEIQSIVRHLGKGLFNGISNAVRRVKNRRRGEEEMEYCDYR